MYKACIDSTNYVSIKNVFKEFTNILSANANSSIKNVIEANYKNLSNKKIRLLQTQI